MESWVDKIKSRETIAAIVALATFVLTMFDIVVDANEVEKAISGLVSAIVLVAFIWNRAVVKSADANFAAIAMQVEASAFDSAVRHAGDGDQIVKGH